MECYFDAIIVGAGQAGPSLAGRLTEAGWTVAIVERKLLGGTCVNVGCTPTKTMVASADAAHKARSGELYGFNSPEIEVSLTKVKARTDAVVGNSRAGLEKWLGGMAGCTVYRGAARFESPTQMSVNGHTLSAPHIFLNVGARPVKPAWPGMDHIPYLTSSTILELTEIPEHLIVVGGSYIGLEFAQMFRRFGSQVTVIERSPRIVMHEDEDVSACVQGILEGEGIRFRLKAECIELKPSPKGVSAQVDCDEGEPTIEGTQVLLAVGRVPNTDDLATDKAGIAVDPRGYVQVDDQLRTSVPGIWAMGDCNGKGAFTHTAYNDFEIVAANLLDSDPRKVSDRIPCHALYVDPPLAQIGMTEAQVRASGRPALMGLRPMAKVGRAVEKGEAVGFIKVLVDAATDHILGASILGPGADEAIHCILTAMYSGQGASLLRRSVHIHPTVAELIPTTFEELKPLP
jgi:pyruvate/2-oxoglutarate dehydrogenase complex dihydrolipoamide dehydrogenase (E3) component